MINSEAIKRKGERLYNIWCNMKNRCYNKNNPKYKDYGGRNIYICEEWKDNYDKFRKWIQK